VCRAGGLKVPMLNKQKRAGWWAIAGFSLAVGLTSTQAQTPTAPPQQSQDIPDAPTPQPGAGKAPVPSPREEAAPPASAGPANQLPPRDGMSPNVRKATTRAQDDDSVPAPPLNIKTVPQGGATRPPNETQEQLFTISRNVNQVMIPVRVTTSSGHLVDGLLAKDISVYEDGKKQTLNFFTSDPFALSAAVVLDLGMPDVAVQKVNQTFSALEGAFSPYDEVSLFTYSSAVSRQTDFSTANRQLTATLNDLKTVRGRNNGPPVMSGPLGPQGPTINGQNVDSSAPVVSTPPKESHVLNDAILAAALDLSKRDKTRRKVIFVISDGREYRSSASYRDVLKVLQSNGIAVYGVGVEGAALPGFKQLGKIHLPLMGYTDLLPKYASATAGEMFTDFSSNSMEDDYARAMGEARNQYTVGYATRLTPSSAYRQVEVRVARPDVKVFARDGYYPLPMVR
jgi:VWFA-related protein